MTLVVFILGRVPPCIVTTGVVTVLLTWFSPGVIHITILLASIDEFSFYPV